MNVCPKCLQRFADDVDHCPTDKASLVRDDVVDAYVGRTIGNFRIERIFGAGGMGTVFLARHVKIGTPAIVKVLAPELVRHREMKLRFENEARLASAVIHPNVVRVYDCGEIPSSRAGAPPDDTDLYIVMELVEGEDGEAVLHREGRLDPLRAARIVREVALALDAAHTSAAGAIVHRDLKPGNIRLTRRGREEHAVVLDFGIAKAVEAPAAESLTVVGTIIGTPQYLSPEQATGEPVDARSDIYALGVVAYELFSGKLPFFSPTTMGYIGLHVCAPPPPFPAELGLPKEMEALVLRCLAKAPKDRFQTAAEVADACGAFLARATAQKRRPVLVAGVALTLVLALAAAAYGLFFKTPPAPPANGGGIAIAKALQLGALAVDGRDLAPGGTAYTRQPRVRLAGRVDRLDAGGADGAKGAVAVLQRTGRPPVRAAIGADGAFEADIEDLVAGGVEDVTIAVLRGDTGAGSGSGSGSGNGGGAGTGGAGPAAPETVGRLRLVRDTTAPSLSPRAIPSEAYAIDWEARLVHVRAPRAFLPLEVADDTDGPVVLEVEAEAPLAAEIGSGDGGRGVRLDGTGLEEGRRARLALRAVDAAGNAGALELTIACDGVPPRLEVREAAATGATGPIRAVVAARDPSGTASLALGGETPSGKAIPPRPPLGLTDPGREGEVVATFAVEADEEGTYVLRVEARDRAGNRGSVEHRVERRVPLEARVVFRTKAAADAGASPETAPPLEPPADGSPLFVSAPALVIEIAANKGLEGVRATLGGESDAAFEPRVLDLARPARDGDPWRGTVELVPGTVQKLTLALAPRSGEPLSRAVQIVQDGVAPVVRLIRPATWAETIGLALAPAPAHALEVEVAVEDANAGETVAFHVVSTTEARAAEIAAEVERGVRPPTAPAAEPKVDAAGRAAARVPLVHGTALLLVAVATDRAGNTAVLVRRARVDLRPPTIIVAALPRQKLHERVTLRFRTDEPCRRVRVDGSADGVRPDPGGGYVHESILYLDSPLGRRIEVEDEAGNTSTAEATLARENVCANSGEAIPPSIVEILLGDDPRASGCPHCPERAISPERKP